MRKLAAALAAICAVAVAGYAAIATGALAASQSDHSPVVGVSIDCAGNVAWTATAWNGPDRQSRSHPAIVVSEVVDGAATTITTNGFSASWNYAFGGSFTTDRDTVTIRAYAHGSWGDRTPGGQTAEATVAKSAECFPPVEGGDGAAATTTTGPTVTGSSPTDPPTSAEDQYGNPIVVPSPEPQQPAVPLPPPAPNTVVIVYKQRVIIGCAAGFTRLAGNCWMVPR